MQLFKQLLIAFLATACSVTAFAEQPKPVNRPEELGFASDRFASARVTVDDRFVGPGYGIPTAESREAIELTARTEALFLDPTYTGKAMAGLIARVRRREFDKNATVLFWHTGGQVALFA